MKHAMPSGAAMEPSGVPALPASAASSRAGARRALLLLVALSPLAACTADPGQGNWWNPMGLANAPTSPPPATGVVLPVRAADPLAAFAARAEPGQTETVSGSAGVTTARLTRVYNAASGRECRELQFGSAGVPGGAPGATYCNDPTQGWVAARPLLRGGAVYRP
ncbi:hypothetical protein [Roseomonas indoligenes]|uniref:Surface antigen domain-containing protein n=1 Tax=Roseomonas indoligenes TaxID=2820811 RepID=A0A940MYU3_9PROT|nr:hypothetical protein [Pararoseomonas indoligenes]MBP0491197.1 hypothetical protein [Pararoseomonas indoligenes]